MRRVQIGIDDLSPRPTQSFELWKNVERLIGMGLKIDVFVPFAIVRDGDGPYSILDYPKFMKRLEEISLLPEVALNIHGYHHGWGDSNNDEFLLGDKDSIEERLAKIDGVIEESGLNFKKVFRPPAFRICQDSVDLLVKHNYTHLSLFDGHKSGDHYQKSYSGLDLSKIKVHYCNCAPPHDGLIGLSGDLAITYHFSTFLANKISYEFVEDLMGKLDSSKGFRFEPYHIYET